MKAWRRMLWSALIPVVSKGAGSKAMQVGALVGPSKRLTSASVTLAQVSSAAVSTSQGPSQSSV